MMHSTAHLQPRLCGFEGGVCERIAHDPPKSRASRIHLQTNIRTFVGFLQDHLVSKIQAKRAKQGSILLQIDKCSLATTC